MYVPPALYRREDVEALSSRLTADFYAQKAARDVIYAAVSRWAGVMVEPGGQIPIVRDGQVVEWRGGLPIFDHVTPILTAARLAPVSRLKAERAQLRKLLDALQTARQCMEELELEFSPALDRTWQSGGRGRGEPVDIVHALGIEQALAISLHGAMRNIRIRLKDLEEELALQPSGRGRPKIRPAHEVARAFAELYARVTGRRPTCSVSDGMFSGDFAPMLRDLFDAFGWTSTDIRGPGSAAVEAITDEYLRSCEPLKIIPFGGLLGSPR